MKMHSRKAWEVWWARPTGAAHIETNRLLDVTAEALPRGVETMHLPGTSIPDTEVTEVMHLRHLYDVRTRPHLYFDTHVDQVVDGWHARARTQGRLLYDCAPCKITWLVAHDADACPMRHPMPEDD